MKNIFNISFVVLLPILGMSGVVCKKINNVDQPGHSQKLTLMAEHMLPFSEPSGIAWSEEFQSLWVVSGGDQHIYRLDTNGNVLGQLAFTGVDLEGITFDGTDSSLWAVDEQTKEVIHLNRSGHVISRATLFYTSDRNKGPEGITIGKNHQLFVLNERDPSVVMRLDAEFGIDTTYSLGFASDYSDITYDSSADLFFILSDESSAFYLWRTDGTVVERFDLPGAKNEGIAVDRKRKKVYIVNDQTGMLSIYSMISVF